MPSVSPAATTSSTYSVSLPGHLWHPQPQFEDDHRRRVVDGQAVLSRSRIAIVGLARNCAQHLAGNLERLAELTAICAGWQLHIEANDCDDDTVPVLTDYCRRHTQATFHYQILGHVPFGAEFAGRRTIAMATHRDACQRWVRACAADTDYVVAIDWDQWGGWNVEGVLNGIGWLLELPGAYGMASVSLAEMQTLTMDRTGQTKVVPQWIHYDAWAMRGVGQPACYWDDYSSGHGGWKHHWIPPVGSQPVLVASAFGGLCIYRTAAYLKGSYDGTRDCEHVPYHESVSRATGQNLYVCPSMRCLMSCLPPDADNAGQHRDD